MSAGDRKPYWDASKSAADSYDKTILWLTGGALALSAKYVTDNLDTVTTDWTLLVGWALLALSVLMLLAALMCSQFACLVEYDRTDDNLKNRWRTAASALNWLILVAVSGGVFFVLLYFYGQLG